MGGVAQHGALTLRDALRAVGIDVSWVGLVTVNGSAVPDMGHVLAPGDSVEVFPIVDGG